MTTIVLDAGRMVTDRDAQVPRTRRTRVFLHVGEPKTGTTYLQDALWGNRADLAARGLQLPGYTDRDHSRASRDLRDTPRPAGDPADPWAGEWDVLAAQALRSRDRAVISNELLAAASPEQAGRAMASLLRAEIHVVATVRDLSALLSAEWQEAVKCGGTASWDAWLADVIAAEPAPDRRSRSWFWRVHDTLAILEMWSRYIPPEHVHVVTVPKEDTAGLLWARFAAVTGIEPGGLDLSRARRNSSLGVTETEFLRRMNEALPQALPEWFYVREIKQTVAHGVLSGRPRRSRVALLPGQQAWAAERAEIVIAGLRDAQYHVVGDLGDLRPAAGALPQAGPVLQLADQQLEAAVQTAAALADRCYRLRYPAPRPRDRCSVRQRASDLKWGLLNGRRIRHVLRRGSRRAAVRRLRVMIWCVLMRPGRPQRSAAPDVRAPDTAQNCQPGPERGSGMSVPAPRRPGDLSDCG